MSRQGLEAVKGAIRNGKGAVQGEHLIRHGAYAIVQAYYRGNVDRRSTLGQEITAWENGYATHKGYAGFYEAPIVLQESIRLAVGNRLFQMFYQPSEDAKTGAAALRASENTLARLLRDFGLKPERKDVDLARAMMEESE